jgi:hypothetical protein
MNKRFLCSIAFLSLMSFAKMVYGQPDSLKKGAYRNNVDFNNNKPCYQSEFSFIHKINDKIPELYKVEAINSYPDNEIIAMGIWGIYDGEFFYLNVKRFDMLKGYIRIKIEGPYAYFIGKPIKSLQQKAEIQNSAVMFGMTGAVISNTSINNENKDKVHYVLNFKSGIINLLTKEYLQMILKPYDDLLMHFNQEADCNSLETLKRYLKMLNERILSQ